MRSWRGPRGLLPSGVVSRLRQVRADRCCVSFLVGCLVCGHDLLHVAGAV